MTDPTQKKKKVTLDDLYREMTSGFKSVNKSLEFIMEVGATKKQMNARFDNIDRRIDAIAGAERKTVELAKQVKKVEEKLGMK